MPYFLCLVLLLVFPSLCQARAINCSPEEQLQAEKASETANNWHKLFLAYHKFANCDDGGTAEGFSDTVMKLLADNWETSPRLFELAAHDDGFKNFVLNHIDATGDDDDIKKLEDNAEHLCPNGDTEMCKLIVVRAKAALDN
jgi:hypothetical protein